MRAVLRESVEATVLAALIFGGLLSVLQPFRVEQTSMEPTLHDGQYLLVDRLAYLDPGALLARRAAAAEPNLTPTAAGTPRRGDVVVLIHPTEPGAYLVKRVVGLPGETIEVKGGQVLVDERPLDEPRSSPVGYSLAPQLVPPGQVFVLGDNHDQSYDSHLFGPVPIGWIVGKAILLPSLSLPPRPGGLAPSFRGA